MIKIENTNFSYTGDEKILQDINLTVNKGECLLLCGESGCGKTTLTKLINGLIPHFVTGGTLTGQVWVGGCAVAEARMYELARLAGSVFQNPKSQFFNLDSDSEITFGLENEGLAPELIKERLDMTTTRLHNEHLRGRNIFSMSGGEKQSLAFASVYAMQPPVFVLDEPSANLDAEAVRVLQEQIKWIKQGGNTIVIAEHRLYFLMDLVDRAVYLKDGHIERIYTGEEFRQMTEADRLRLGLRSLQAVRLALPEAAQKTDKDGLAVQHLSYAYKKHQVLRDIQFSASYGDIVGIAGSNGIGKTTLCLVLCGLLKGFTGSIKLDGKELSLKEMQANAALVMQDVNHQLFSDSVWNECMLSSPEAVPQQIEELLNHFNLLDYKDTHPMALSGGQKQRLAVASAILSGKRILLFDEPTSGLDYRHMTEVSSLFKRLSESGHIVLVVSHDTEFLNATCTSMLIM